jgi:hypothetical protein
MELADALAGALPTPEALSGDALARCNALEVLEVGLARLLRVELIEMSWSNWFSETS